MIEVAEEIKMVESETDRDEDAVVQTHRISSLPELEAAWSTGILVSWESLAEDDPTTTCFQGPVWCMEWYRHYRESFRPLVLVVTRGHKLVGLVSLAVEISTGRLAFAGDNMSDYRDVVAAAGYREMVVAELIRLYRDGSFPNSFRIGPTQPESETTRLLLSRSGHASGVWAVPRFDECWRWWRSSDDPAEAEKLIKKKHVKQHLNYYKRQGTVALERLGTYEDWQKIRQEFFDLHSLRQLYVRRPVSFNNPHKRALFDTLIRDYPSSVHLCALFVDDRLLAAHFGHLWRDVVYWTAPTYDVREDKHSPGSLLLAWLIKDSEAHGLRGIDLTLGTEDFKRRFSNERVEVPSVDLYAQGWRYYTRFARDKAVASARVGVGKVLGPRKWNDILERGEAVRAKVQKGRELGLKRSAGRAAQHVRRMIGEKTRGLFFLATPADVREAAPRLEAEETCTIHRDEYGDLLKWEGASSEVASLIASLVKELPELRRNGRTLHTILIADRLAGWGFSYWPREPAFITETQTTFEFEPESVMLYDFETIPEFRGRKLYQTLLSNILRERFAEGAQRAYISCVETNHASRRAIERVGFRLVAVHELRRLLWRRRSKRQEINDPV